MEKKWSTGAHAAFWENSRVKAGPEVASIDSSQNLIMDYQLTELLVAVVEGQRTCVEKRTFRHGVAPSSVLRYH